MIPRFTHLRLFSAEATSGLTTDTPASVSLAYRRDGLAGALVIRSVAGTAPSITGKIQHSPSPDSVSDAAAVWFDLLTFPAQTAVGGQFQAVTGAYFPRLRAQLTRGGTAVTELSYDFFIV